MAECDNESCARTASTVSRLSPEGYLVASGKRAYSFREAYERFHYCNECHVLLMTEVWARVRSSGSKDEGHVAPTAV